MSRLVATAVLLSSMLFLGCSAEDPAPPETCSACLHDLETCPCAPADSATCMKVADQMEIVTTGKATDYTIGYDWDVIWQQQTTPSARYRVMCLTTSCQAVCRPRP